MEYNTHPIDGISNSSSSMKTLEILTLSWDYRLSGGSPNSVLFA